PFPTRSETIPGFARPCQANLSYVYRTDQFARPRPRNAMCRPRPGWFAEATGRPRTGAAEGADSVANRDAPRPCGDPGVPGAPHTSPGVRPSGPPKVGPRR